MLMKSKILVIQIFTNLRNSCYIVSKKQGIGSFQAKRSYNSGDNAIFQNAFAQKLSWQKVEEFSQNYNRLQPMQGHKLL